MYKYFVPFVFDKGEKQRHGSIHFEVVEEIVASNAAATIKSMTDYIEKQENLSNVVVLSFDLLGGVGCRTLPEKEGVTYDYFISFAYVDEEMDEERYENAIFSSNQKFSTENDDIWEKAVRDWIEKERGYKKVVLINYRLLKK